MLDIFDFNPWLLLPLVSAIYLATSGVIAFLREPKKLVRQAFFALSLSLAGTYFFQSFIYAVSKEAPVMPLQQAILIFILLNGVAVAVFIKVLLRIEGWKRTFTALYILTGVFIVLNLTPWAIDFSRLHPLPWNMAPSLSVLGQVMMTFFQIEVVFTLYLAWKTYHDEKVNIRIRSRARIAFWATIIGSLAATDFWHYYGVPVPPVGAIFIAVWMTLFLYAMSGKYRIFDITPETAGSALVDAIPGALFITDNDGKIVIANSVACRMLGFDALQLKGTPILELFPHIKGNFSENVESGMFDSGGGEFRIQKKDGRLMHVSVSSSPVQRKLGVASGYVFIAMDISDALEQVDIIRKQKEELQRVVEDMQNIQDKLVGREKKMIELKDEITKLKRGP